MDHPAFRVIVIRAWRDAGGVRVRLLTDGDQARQWVVGSIVEAREVVGLLLAELLGAPANAAGTEPATTLPAPPDEHCRYSVGGSDDFCQGTGRPAAGPS